MLHYLDWRRTGNLSGDRRRMLVGWLLGIVALSLSGCMDLETVVRVETDGSGTISDRIVVSNEVFEMIKGVAPEGQAVPMFNEEKLRAATYSYGEGVTFLSAEGIETDSGKGYIAHYAFADVNLIHVGQDPEDKMPGGGMSAAGNDEEGKFTTFSMEPGRPASLTIHWPIGEGGQESKQEWEATEVEDPAMSQTTEQQEATMAMMKAAFKDLHMAMRVEVGGEVIETNATHLSGNRITLADISFAKFLQNEDALKAMATSEQQDVADIKALMALIPGLTLEVEPEVTILFE